MKKIFLLLSLIAIATPEMLEANRTLIIKNKAKSDISFYMYNYATPVKGFRLDPSRPTHVKPGQSYSGKYTNHSFDLRFNIDKKYEPVLYAVPAGKDGDAICLEVDDNGVKECKK